MKKPGMFAAWCFFWLMAAPLWFAGASFAQELTGEPISPIPQSIELDERKVSLGEKLFHDGRLSKNKQMSCASCHDINRGGVIPGEQYSLPGVSGETVKINIPTVYNSGLNFSQFWDGRAESLEDQIDGPIHNADEMGASWQEIMIRLRKDKAYSDAFYKIYRSPPTEKAIKDAIATYERSLITPNAPFDRYLRGDPDAITDVQKRGYRYFKNLGCVACHQGKNIGGNMHQSFGILGDYFEDRGSEMTEADLGRFNVTGEESDKFVFKVPSLRNIDKTAPYFHDGSAETLEEAVDVMARYQLGRDLSDDERMALVAFLKSLTGDMKAAPGAEVP